MINSSVPANAARAAYNPFFLYCWPIIFTPI